MSKQIIVNQFLFFQANTFYIYTFKENHINVATSLKYNLNGHNVC
mgnify:CR=1 FL=1